MSNIKSKNKRKKLKAVPNPRSPGFTNRAARVEKATAQIHEQVRREFKRAGHEYDRSLVLQEADKRMTALLKREDTEVYKQYLRTAPISWAPRRDDLFDKIEVAAIRQTPQAQELEAILRGEKGATVRGRPSDRRLPIAVFLRNALEKGRPEVRSNVRDFTSMDLQLDWAYGKPVRGAMCGIHERSVLATMQAMLDREDPDTAIVLNIDAIKTIVERDGDVGRYVTIDGTHAHVWAEQTKARIHRSGGSGCPVCREECPPVQGFIGYSR